MAYVRVLAKLLLRVNFEQSHVPLHEGYWAIVLHVEVERTQDNRLKLDQPIL